jgi:porin
MIRTVALLMLFVFVGSVVTAQEKEKGKAGYDNDPRMSGPGSTSSQLEEDDKAKTTLLRMPWFDEHLQPWFDFKSDLREKSGLQVGAAYNALYQTMSDVPDGAEDSAGSGIFRIFGRWELVGKESGNTGALVFSADNRHGYTDVAPQNLGFQGGYLGIPGALFSDADTLLGDLNWQQSFNDGNCGLVIGRYDPNDFFDVLGYANPWTSFQNLHILFNTTIALPDWSTGLGLGHWMNDQWYVKAAVNDANGVATETEFFEDFGELYTTAEIGWSPSHEARYFQNIHVTAWHADEREDAGVEESEGIAIGANWTVDQTWMAFIKAGWSDGSAPMYNESVTVGAIYHVARRSDLAGLAVNWGDPADSSLRDQYTTELFYRLQLAQNLAITPSVQLVIDPALNEDEDQIWIYGMRARLTL